MKINLEINEIIFLLKICIMLINLLENTYNYKKTPLIMKTFLFIQKFLQLSFISLVLTLVMIYLPLSIYVCNQAQKKE